MQFKNVKDYESYMEVVCEKAGVEYNFFNWFWNIDGVEDITKKALTDDGYNVEHPVAD